MAGETSEIRRDIAATRHEIDEHLQELGGRVQATLNIRQQAERNLPGLLAGAAVAGLLLGLISGRGRRHHERLVRLATRERLRGEPRLMSLREPESAIP